MNIHKAYKYRLYPNQQQKELLEKHFGCVRFVYNYFLNERRVQYQETGKSDNYYAQAKTLTSLKNDFEWLNDVNAQSLQSSLRNLETAYQRFFQKKSMFPNFKKKNAKNSFTVPQRVSVKGNKIVIPKFRDGIKFKQHRELQGKILYATISKSSTHKYYISFAVEQEIEVRKPTNKEVGIDVGIKDFCTLSTGKKYKNNKFTRKYEKKLKIAQKHLSRKKKGSRQFENQKLKVTRIHEKISNCRKDYLHKVSSEITKQFDFIALENLNVQGMIKNHKLAKAISDVGWYSFTQMLEYKSLWNGGKVSRVDRFYPSSKTCHICGWINQSLKLEHRKWHCQNCGVIHDRDVNASKNILLECKRTSLGTSDYTNGAEVRLGARKSKKQSAMKLEASCFS